MQKITIYGKEDCNRCEQVKKVLCHANYYHFSNIFDHYGVDVANEIIVSSNGNLPIVVITTDNGMVALGLQHSGLTTDCEGGSCKL